MHCDAVFKRLTEGPFPDGRDGDERIEAHLAVCPRCAELAEALTPAPELFHEALTPLENRDLPSYRGRYAGRGRVATGARLLLRAGGSSTAIAGAIKRLSTLASAPTTNLPPRRDQPRSALRVEAALVLGFVAAVATVAWSVARLVT